MSEKDLVKAESTAVQVSKNPSNYIALVLESTKREFTEANSGLDLDFVRMGEWLTINKKGNYVEANDETISFGDNIDVVVGYGEQRWSVWGNDDSPEKGQLLVAAQTEEQAHQEFSAWMMENQDRAADYSLEDIQLRYMANVVPVQSLAPEEFPKIYLMSFSPSDTVEFGRFAFSIFTGKYKAGGVPAKTAVSQIVTRLTTEEKQSKKNASQKWIGNKFTPVGLFNPSDYGIKVDPVPAEQA